jgi:sec-independent protein translocase protein TatA
MISTLTGSMLGIFNIGPTEMAFILVVALLLFGKRLPEVARSMGKSITEFKKGLNDAQADIHAEIQREPTRPALEAPRSVEPVTPVQTPPTTTTPAAPPTEHRA